MAVTILILIALYFLPSIIGFARHKRNGGAIFALNLFLGWTCVGWVVSLVWALTKDEIVVVNKTQ
ncbi:MAG: superinfection immunity protein [Candidatus Pacebacteria bacterium]|nr:superinfection immunity protein [Candidatus Paceibacterota bacterium]